VSPDWQGQEVYKYSENIPQLPNKTQTRRHTMVITDETIDYVGILAKLELSDEEKEQAKKDMSDMLDYVSKLNELDTENVEAMSHTFSYNNVFREDEVTNGDDRENMLSNAPEQKDGCYKVPRTFD
jgi:aspartyl-tRNA(Asn)/glutamyl-tRNA(Gln) amidotransferase subunit C